MGFPVVSVTEVEGGIQVRQDRFLESGPPEAKDNETIWFVRSEFDLFALAEVNECFVFTGRSP